MEYGKRQKKVSKVIPVLAEFESMTFDFRESKCLFRGPEKLTGINNYTR